jgi:hypothetical protein
MGAWHDNICPRLLIVASKMPICSREDFPVYTPGSLIEDIRVSDDINRYGIVIASDRNSMLVLWTRSRPVQDLYV